MKIAVNTRLLIPNTLEGIGWFTYENFKRITRSHPEHDFYFLFDRAYDPQFVFGPNVHPVVIHPQARHPFLFLFWFDVSVKRALRKIKPDLFVSPDGYMPRHPDYPTLAVMHDLNFEHFPKDLPYFDRWYYRTFFPQFARKATRLATVSGFSKSDITEQYGVPPDKIDVVYNGANETFEPISNAEKAVVRNRLTKGKPYFLFIGALHPRKNLVNLFRAFDLFKSRQESDLALLIVGNRKWWTGDMEAAYSGLKHREDVFFSGRQNAEGVHNTMGAAFALTYVSYFEGFGIPIVEAFRCGTPVITSNVTSMPEIAGDAALLTNPFDPESIADAMQNLHDGPALRQELISRGLERSREFTWDKSAERLWQAMQKTAAT